MKDTILSGLAELGLAEKVPADAAEKLERYGQLLIEKNKVMNLTAITDVEGVITKHYCDCLKICKHIDKNSKMLDVGCGGGFPTLPIAIARKDISITALDSTAKKLDFVSRAAKELSLNVTTLAARAEEVGKSKEYREGFDVVCARAVSRFNILSELCLPLVKKNGKFISMKGSSGMEELEEAKKGISLLGGELAKTDSFNMSGMERYIFVIKKTGVTPDKYPRMYSKICKNPL